MKLTGNHLKGFWTKKKILLVSLTLIFAIGVGVTTAYMWEKEETKTTQFKDAKVDCEVYENSDKNCQVKNSGTVDCYVRITYTVNFVNKEGELHYTKPQEGVHYSLSLAKSGDWQWGIDGYYYYTKAIKPGESADEAPIHVIPKSGANSPAGYTLKTTVTAEAVQALPNQYDTIDKDPAYLDAWKQSRYTLQPYPQRELLNAKVMTFNIRQSGTYQNEYNYGADTSIRDWYDRRDALTKYIFNQNCDIIMLQEVTGYQLSYYIKKAVEDNNYDYYWQPYVEKDTSWSESPGLMIIYKKDKFERVCTTTGGKDDRSVIYETFQGTVEDREKAMEYYSMYLGIALRMKNPPSWAPENSLLFVHNVHLHHENLEFQRNAANTIVAKIQEKTEAFPHSFHLVGGDFNSTLSSEWKQIFDDSGLLTCFSPEEGPTLNDWEDYAQLGGAYLPLYAPHYSTLTQNEAIDFVFGQSDRMEKTEFKVDHGARWISTDIEGNENEVYYSAHFAVIGNVLFYANAQ